MASNRAKHLDRLGAVNFHTIDKDFDPHHRGFIDEALPLWS
jgi:hypothetical protein